MTMDAAGAMPPGDSPVAPDTLRSSYVRNARWSTGVFTGLWVVTSALAIAAEPGDESLPGFSVSADVGTTLGSPLLQALGSAMLLAGVVSWMLLSQWMCSVAYVRRSEGLRVPSNAWIWWMWIVPIANLFSPAKTMKHLAHGSVSTTLLMTWWLPFLVAIGDIEPSLVSERVGYAVDAGAIVIAWFALDRIIRQVASAPTYPCVPSRAA
ncbi:hypothetical protein [Demequina salsinemoris]|uniref:hypothetical protein n=1 Tax=Demequina salsinemoris TaxID=577470 RepID=UPI0007833740|nr:hypothetical protein [Demequina salsinemoris]